MVLLWQKKVSYIKSNEKGKCSEKQYVVNSLKVFIHIQVPMFLDCNVMHVFAHMYNIPEKFCHTLQKFLFIKILCTCIYSIYILANFTHGPKNLCITFTASFTKNKCANSYKCDHWWLFPHLI